MYYHFCLTQKEDCFKTINFVAILILSFILAIISNKALILSTGSHNGSIKETMRIPTQIMGWIYDNFASDEEKGIKSEYIPNAKQYKYYLSDPMKKDLPFEKWKSKLPTLCDVYVTHFRLTDTTNPQSIFLNMTLYICVFTISSVILV